MTGPGHDEEEYMWPGPTYTDCKRCGECTRSYYADLCEKCERKQEDKPKDRKPA